MDEEFVITAYQTHSRPASIVVPDDVDVVLERRGRAVVHPHNLFVGVRRGAGEGGVGPQPPPRYSQHNGNLTSKQVSPGLDSKRISPLWRVLTMRRAMSSPRPLPSPTPLVVKNGSKIRCWTSAGMPGPSSTTSITAP